MGTAGSGLGYAGINNSVAIKFDLFDDAGEGDDSTGLYVNGASPTVPATDLADSGIDLHSGDVFSVALTYDGTNLTETITDTATSASGTWSYPVNIPSAVGGNTAYVGFTGSTGTATATQDILTWTYASLPTAVPTAPTHLTAAAASGTQINLGWTDAGQRRGRIYHRTRDGAGRPVHANRRGRRRPDDIHGHGASPERDLLLSSLRHEQRRRIGFHQRRLRAHPDSPANADQRAAGRHHDDLDQHDLDEQRHQRDRL